MAGVFDIELHDVETVEVDSEDDVIEIEEVILHIFPLFVIVNACFIFIRTVRAFISWHRRYY